MRDKKDIPLAEKEWGHLGKPAGAALAAVVPEDSGKGALALWLIKESVKNEASA
jgi:hypothetical protein